VGWHEDCASRNETSPVPVCAVPVSGGITTRRSDTVARIPVGERNRERTAIRARSKPRGHRLNHDGDGCNGGNRARLRARLEPVCSIRRNMARCKVHRCAAGALHRDGLRARWLSARNRSEDDAGRLNDWPEITACRKTVRITETNCGSLVAPEADTCIPRRRSLDICTLPTIRVIGWRLNDSRVVFFTSMPLIQVEQCIVP
jgi:hypothetical protein